MTPCALACGLPLPGHHARPCRRCARRQRERLAARLRALCGPWQRCPGCGGLLPHGARCGACEGQRRAA